MNQLQSILAARPDRNSGVAVVWIGMILTVVFLFPGHINGDTLFQYEQGATERYGDWHPPLWAFVWHLIHVLNLPILPFYQMFMLTAFMYWIAVASTVVMTFPTNRSAGIAAAVVGFFPPDFLSLNYIVKDSFLMSILLCSYSALLRSEANWSRSLWLAGTFGLAFAVGIRHNAIFAVIPLAAWAAQMLRNRCINDQQSKRPQRLIVKLGTPLTTAIFAVATVLVNTAVSNALVVPQNRVYPAQQLLLLDIVGISVATQTNLVPNDYPFPRSERDDAGKLLVMNQLYYPESNYTLYWNGLDNGGIAMRRFPIIGTQSQANSLWLGWWHAASKFPAIYLCNRMKIMNALLATQRYQYKGDYPAPGEYLFLPETALSSLRLMFLTSGWPYLVLLMVLGILQALRRIKLSSANLALWASAFIYIAAYFFVAVDHESRYMFWPILATTLLLARMIGQYVTQRQHIAGSENQPPTHQI